ncbi:hypothetical protein [Streptomyces sp. NPDC097610]|uniref:hypothetical protein n=1 Tax=Streptomyces sp. NPDC097610 TaxID=3157227 RepID=UPI0033259585
MCTAGRRDPAGPLITARHLGRPGGDPLRPGHASPGRRARTRRAAAQGGWIEGPNLYRRGPWYYLLTADGGTGCVGTLL